MDPCTGTIILRCEDRCCTLVIDRYNYNGEIDYNISIQDSNLYSEYNTFLGRIKRAAKILFGKPIYYNDVWITDKNKIKELSEKLNNMLKDDFISEHINEIRAIANANTTRNDKGQTVLTKDDEWRKELEEEWTKHYEKLSEKQICQWCFEEAAQENKEFCENCEQALEE